MSCFWTDLVAATQFCEPESGGGSGFGLLIQNFDSDEGLDRFRVTVAEAAPGAFSDAMNALVTPPIDIPPGDVLDSPVKNNPFWLRRAEPALAGFLVSSDCAFSGISEYETAPKSVDTDAYLNPSETFDSGEGSYSYAFDDTIDSGTLTVTEAYIAYFQLDSSDVDVIGIAVAELPTERFIVGIPSAGVLRVDYAGGSEPASGEFTLYGSEHEGTTSGSPAMTNTANLASIVRVTGSVVTGASGSIDVDCYIIGHRNGAG